MNITGLEEGEEGTVVCLPPFSEPDWFWGFAQVMMLMCVYGYILFFASNMLSAGSERDRSARSIRSNASGLSGLAIAQSPTAEEVSKHFCACRCSDLASAPALQKA